MKALGPEDLEGAGVRALVANAYHLHLRPGVEVIRGAGGLHAFMGWERPLVTSSGGYQIRSLARAEDVDEGGVTFRSHLDGTRHRFTPETSVEIQAALGADVMTALDRCPPRRAGREAVRAATERTLGWLDRCRDRRRELAGRAGLLFPVVHGGSYGDLRAEALERTLAAGEWTGLTLGGLWTGEPRRTALETLDACASLVPRGTARHVAGLGYPADVLAAIGRGMDLFDSVAPTRNGRNGTAFTSRGTLHVEGARLADDLRPLDPACGCACCRRHSRAYLRHLFARDELLGLRLLSLHNVSFLADLTSRAREAILAGEFDAWSRGRVERYREGDA